MVPSAPVLVTCSDTAICLCFCHTHPLGSPAIPVSLALSERWEQKHRGASFTRRGTGGDGEVVPELEIRQALGQNSFRAWSQAETSQGPQKPVSVVTIMTSLGWPGKDVGISPSKMKG